MAFALVSDFFVEFAYLPDLGVDAHQFEFKGRPVTAIRASVENWRKLKSHGLPLPAPMQDYAWPGRFKPYEHQRETAEFLASTDSGFCTDDAGTGKTLASLWAMDWLMRAGEVRRALIVAPKSICEHVWGRELFQSFPDRSHAVITDKDRKAKHYYAASRDFQILVINPESLPIVAGKLVDVDLVIVDEFTKFKNPSAVRYKALKKLAKEDGKRLWMMSGTPAPQSPEDAYGPIQLVNPTGMSARAWKELTMKHVSGFRWVPRPEAPEIIARYMRPSIRHKLEECVDMPEISYQDLEVDMTPEQEALIKKLLDEAKAELNGVQITAVNAAAVMGKCLQALGGGVYQTEKDGEGKEWHRVPAGPYFDAIAEFVEEASTPVIIFAPFVSSVTAIHEELGKRGVEAGLITGATKQAERSQLFDQVQAGTLKALVAVPGTMSHGVTLTTSRYVLWACPTYSFETYSQGNSRVYRNGQRNAVVITHLVQNSIAKELFSRLQSQASVQELVLSLLKDGG